MNFRALAIVLRAPLVAALSSVFIACGSASSSDVGSSGGDAGGDNGNDGSASGGDSGGGADGGAKDSGGAVGDAGAPPPGTTSISIIVEPSDNGAALVSAIQGAKTSVHMTMYLLSSTQVINALIAQHNAGHDVKVLLNQTFPTAGESNSSVYSQLQGAGVDVKWAPSGFTLTHEKCVIIDNATAWIMTMNATQSSARDNREYLAVDTDSADVAEAEQIFEADFANSALVPSGNLVVAPSNARTKLVALANSAAKSIDMEAEELSDSAVVNALSAAADRGVAVRIVLANTTPTSSQQQAITTLKQHNVKLVTLASPYVHAKSLAVDGVRAYVGSENFSTGSLQYNRELGVIVDNATEVAKIVSTTSTDFSHGNAL